MIQPGFFGRPPLGRTVSTYYRDPNALAIQEYVQRLRTDIEAKRASSELTEDVANRVHDVINDHVRNHIQQLYTDFYRNLRDAVSDLIAGSQAYESRSECSG